MVRGVPGSLCAFIVVTGGVLPHTQAKGEGERGALDGEGKGGRKITAREKGGGEGRRESQEGHGGRVLLGQYPSCHGTWKCVLDGHTSLHTGIVLPCISSVNRWILRRSTVTRQHHTTAHQESRRHIMMTHGPPSVPYLFWLAGDADLPPHEVHQRLADGEA